MSQELILVTKRKYEDLLKRIEGCNDCKDHNQVTTRKEIVEDANGEPAINRSIIAQDNQMNLSTNNQKMDSGTQIIVDNQVGAGSLHFVQMSFDIFDRIHS